jgi:hypothetical protein
LAAFDFGECGWGEQERDEEGGEEEGSQIGHEVVDDEEGVDQ